MKRRASTLKFYKDLSDNHLRPPRGRLRLRDFQTVHAQRALDKINLSHGSLQGIKIGMSALFSHALRLGFVNGHNPVHESQPEGKRSEFEGPAYKAADVELMLGKLAGVPRVAVGVAAFTGMRLAEIKGLQWADYDGQNLYVRRNVWRENVSNRPRPRIQVQRAGNRTPARAAGRSQGDHATGRCGFSKDEKWIRSQYG